MSDVRVAGVDVHCFPLLIASSRAAVCAPFRLPPRAWKWS